MRKLFVLFIGCFMTLCPRAQVQLGLFGGIANYQGDLVDKIYESPRHAIGFTASFPLSTHIYIRSGLTFAKVAGADSLNRKLDLRLRNLSFQSAITELSLVGEYYTFDMEQKNWSPYLFAGL